MGLVRAALNAASALDWLTAHRGLDVAGAGLRAALGKKAPLVSHGVIPAAGTKAGRTRLAPPPETLCAVYFASCAGQMFGPSRDDGDGEPISATLQRLAKKAGFALITPPRAPSLCCGQPFDSKGLAVEADRKAEEALQAVLQASENGKWPVFSDTSPCSQRLKAVAAGRLAVLDLAEFLHDHLLPRTAIPERLLRLLPCMSPARRAAWGLNSSCWLSRKRAPNGSSCLPGSAAAPLRATRDSCGRR